MRARVRKPIAGTHHSRGKVAGLLCLFALLVAGLLPALAGLGFAAAGDTAADRVLGQPGFTTNALNNGGLAVGLNYPYRAAVDGTGRLFVADTNNNRVLIWSSFSTFVNGQGADLVLGQSNLSSSTANYSGVNEYGLSRPGGVAVDGSGRLYVVDRFNHRMLRYSPPFANGKGADLVLGQPDFNSNSPGGASDSRLGYQPQGGVAVTSGGRLFVSDHENHRVGSAMTDGSGVATLAGASLAGIVAGTYPSGVSASFAGDESYESSSGTGSLQVDPAPLTITAGDKTKVYGAALPALTVSYSGFVGGDTEASLSTPPSVATIATAASDAAGNPYPITASGAVGANYSISYVPGTLTVTPAPAGVRYAGSTRVFAGSPITMTATVTQAVPGFAGTMTDGAVIFGVVDAGGNPTSYGPLALSASGVATQTIPAGLPVGIYSVTAQLDPANGNFEGPPAVTVGIISTDPANTLRATQYTFGAPSPGYSYSGSLFTFWQKVRIQNIGATLAKNVRAYIQRVAANTDVIDDYVYVGNISPGAYVWSGDTFKLTVDLSEYSYKCDSFAWRIEYEDTSNVTHTLNPVPQLPPGPAPGGCR